MRDYMTSINRKSVLLSRPYHAMATSFEDREEVIQKILAAWIGDADRLPLSPLLIGEPGIGKNRIVYECAKICGKPLFIFQGHEDVTAEDLMCAVRFSDDPERKMDYIVQPLVSAMIQGGICFIDEIGKIRGRALAPLASLLDERRYIDSNLLGERIFAHPGFRFIAATNTTDLDANALPDFIRSRICPAIRVEYPDREHLNRVIRSRFPILKKNSVKLVEHFWTLWQDKHGDLPPSPRDSIYIFGYALNLADRDAAGDDHANHLDICGISNDLQPRHLESAFETFFQTDKRRPEWPTHP